VRSPHVGGLELPDIKSYGAAMIIGKLYSSI
jgi:hypothetical protein